MTNADKFKGIFGLYATELWAKPEKEFLEWLNADVPETNAGGTISRQAALDALEWKWAGKAALDAIKALQSVQPDQWGLSGWICPVCGRGLSPFTSVCPCNNGKGWEITC